MKLTKASVDELKIPADKKEIIVFDEDLPGFGLRLRLGGKRTWVAQYRFGSKQRRVTLGTPKNLDPDQARKLARVTLARVQLGQDPQAEKAAARAPKALELTVGDLVDRYLPYAEPKLKASTYYGVVLHLRKHWQPLHAYEIRNLERRHIAAELGRISTNSGPYGANRSRAALSALFAWAIAEGLADANPVIGTRKAINEKARDRVLSEEELTLIWRNAGDGDYGDIVRLLILTGQRREEVAAMEWSELDFAKGVWSIGDARTKNGMPHDVPLSAPATRILKGRATVCGREMVFGTRGPFSGWSKAKLKLDVRLTMACRGQALATWRLHDIRRTVATGLADLGVLPHVVEAVLNHISGHKAGVAGVYNRATYADEKRSALDKWASHVTSLVGDE